MKQQKIHLAVVGLGMASKPHLMALRELCNNNHIVVSGLFTRNQDRLSELSKQYDFPTYPSLDAVAQDVDVDGVIIITPPNARAEIVDALASAGKHILMEKPVERNLAGARQIVDICRAKNVSLGMVLQHRFRKGAMAMTELVHSGRLGKLYLARVNIPWWREQSYYDQVGRGTYDVDGGGVLITQAIHVLDLMLSLMGGVKTVHAMMGTTPLHKMEAEDFATAGLIFENGAMGSIVATTSAYPGGVETLEIDAENAALRLEAGELTIHWRDGKTETIGEVTGTGGGADPMAFPYDWHRDLIADFADSIASNTPPKITGAEALNVHQLIDAINQSAKQGCAINVEELS